MITMYQVLIGRPTAVDANLGQIFKNGLPVLFMR